MSEFDNLTGKPIDKTYLEKDLPIYLQKEIEAIVEGINKDPKLSYIDCLYDEAQSSINNYVRCGILTDEQGKYLYEKYIGLEWNGI